VEVRLFAPLKMINSARHCEVGETGRGNLGDWHAPACQALAHLPKSYGEQAAKSLATIVRERAGQFQAM
jgi:hypothetical protein